MKKKGRLLSPLGQELRVDFGARFDKLSVTRSKSLTMLRRFAFYEQPLVEPHESHFSHAPLRTMVSWPHSPQAFPV